MAATHVQERINLSCVLATAPNETLNIKSPTKSLHNAFPLQHPCQPPHQDQRDRTQDQPAANHQDTLSRHPRSLETTAAQAAKMLFLAVATLIPAVLGVAAERRDYSQCAGLKNNNDLVAELVIDYANLIGNYTDDLGESYLADDFTDTSGSINALAGLPLASVTFPSKAAFMANQATQPKIPLNVVSVPSVTCNTVTVRWTQQFGVANQLVSGISVLIFECNDDGDWQLQTLFAEFNSLSYFLNIGGTITPPPSS